MSWEDAPSSTLKVPDTLVQEWVLTSQMDRSRSVKANPTSSVCPASKCTLLKPVPGEGEKRGERREGREERGEKRGREGEEGK